MVKNTSILTNAIVVGSFINAGSRYFAKAFMGIPAQQAAK